MNNYKIIYIYNLKFSILKCQFPNNPKPKSQLSSLTRPNSYGPTSIYPHRKQLVRVVKESDLRSAGHESARVRTPQLLYFFVWVEEECFEIYKLEILDLMN